LIEDGLGTWTRGVDEITEGTRIIIYLKNLAHGGLERAFQGNYRGF
tara:strand:+ start:620 stop:757 length:138 start_codon:yes stop_codon:yes gene_type:complete